MNRVLSKFKLHLLLSVGFFILCSAVFAQVNAVIDITLRVVDARNQALLPFTSVYNKSAKVGTLANENGVFELKNCALSDTVLFTYIGFERKQLTVAALQNSSQVALKPKVKALNEFVVSDKSGLLYKLVEDCRKKKVGGYMNSKSFLQLETKLEEQQVELLECYYNSYAKGYNLDSLVLKNGRIYLDAKSKQLFISTESSRMFSYFRVFDKSSLFPFNPLQLSPSKLKEYYDLTLLESVYDEENKRIYVVHFDPIKDSASYFEGELYIDSASSELRKVSLRIDKTARHPFVSIFGEDVVKNIALELNKTYTKQGKKIVCNQFDFNYSGTVESKQYGFKKQIPFTTKAYMVYYTQNELFETPIFTMPSFSNKDYRRILSVPYNDFFWSNLTEFTPSDPEQSQEMFRQTSHRIGDNFIGGFDSTHAQFEHPYINWSKNRISFREVLLDSINRYKVVGQTPSDLYHLEVQFYLDLNALNGKFNALTACIFDPDASFFYYPMTPETMVFINIYFDLMEIKRRELNETLEQAKSLPVMRELYKRKQAEIAIFSKTYFKEVERGRNRKALQKWNDFVNDKLAVDNVVFFNLNELKK